VTIDYLLFSISMSSFLSKRASLKTGSFFN
jgi:hypothetical protein